MRLFGAVGNVVFALTAVLVVLFGIQLVTGLLIPIILRIEAIA